MNIKSLDELKKIREKSLNKVKLRENGEGDQIEILVGMATCGIASGARETMTALIEEINKEHLDDIKIVQVGCVGYCHSEPCVQVNMPGEKPILYGKVDTKVAKEIIDQHVKNKKVLKEYVIDITHERA